MLLTLIALYVVLQAVPMFFMEEGLWTKTKSKN